ncbi:hypothetical protein [Rhizobium leguminosarum]|uniref:Uncharacterized protein n=1 Tax=Rhizobium leguminosarum TaxID=384 RepID=A0A2Z4YGW0_RHILE|nr:hypothetical protein [Rhizobium leguminosarum]AXA39828.1 hypothetical protein DLJ82_2235 [Rhizobium leguminosarum]
MATLRIYDSTGHGLAVDLGDLLRLMVPQSLQANWTISSVKSSIPGHGWFEATGEGGEQLERLAQQNARLPGSDLAALARNTRQLIWGEFVGSLPADADGKWVTIRAADGTFFEIETDDETVLNKVKLNFKDVRAGESPIASWPLDYPSK